MNNWMISCQQQWLSIYQHHVTSKAYQKAKRGVHFIADAWRYHGFFCWFWVLVTAWLWHRPSWQWGVVWLVITARIWFLGWRRYIVWSIACVCLLSLAFAQWQGMSQVNRSFTSESVTGVLRFLPSQAQTSVERLTGIGWLKIPANNQPIKVRFSASSEFLLDRSTPQQLEVTGRLTLPEGERNFNTFDYAEYLAQHDVYWQFKIQHIASQQGQELSFVNSLDFLRETLLAPFHRQGLGIWQQLVAKLIMNQQNPDFKLWQTTLSTMGIAHLLAISGFHLSYLKRKLTNFCAWCGWRKHLYQRGIFLLLVVYSWLCHWPIGAVRVLALWWLTMGSLKKRVRWTTADYLACVGVLCLLVRPMLAWDIGYLLSFGLSFVLTRSPRKLTRWRLYAWQMVACLLFTWPFMIAWQHVWYGWQWLWVLLIGALFESLIMPIALVSAGCMLTGIGLTVPLTLDQISAQIIQLWVQVMPFWQAMLRGFVTGEVGLIWLSLIVSVAFVWIRWGFQYPFRVALWGICIYAGLVWLRPWCHVEERLTILDVGQGDSLVYQPAWSAQAWLIDTGGQPPPHHEFERWDILQQKPMTEALPQTTFAFDPQFADYNLLPALRGLGVNQIETVLITHPDVDHIGNLWRLILDRPIAHLIISRYTADTKIWAQIEPALSAHTQVHVISPCTKWQLSPFFTLYANRWTAQTESNDTSIAATIQLHQHRLLNLGDMSSEYEALLLQQFPYIQADILKLAHHGSRYSTSDRLLQQIRPQVALISAGAHNHYGHPHQDTLAKLTQANILYRSTAMHGAIQLSYHPLWGYQLRTALNENKTTLWPWLLLGGLSFVMLIVSCGYNYHNIKSNITDNIG